MISPLGPAEPLDWFRVQISQAFEVKFCGRLGPDHADDKSIRILNRVVHWTSRGIGYEADQRHAELILQQLSLGTASKPVGVPSAQTTCTNEDLLCASDAVIYRALAARANYLSQ